MTLYIDCPLCGAHMKRFRIARHLVVCHGWAPPRDFPKSTREYLNAHRDREERRRLIRGRTLEGAGG